MYLVKENCRKECSKPFLIPCSTNNNFIYFRQFYYASQTCFRKILNICKINSKYTQLTLHLIIHFYFESSQICHIIFVNLYFQIICDRFGHHKYQLITYHRSSAQYINNYMRSLQQFLVQNASPLFPNASKLPTFFDHNLVESSRVVKIFQNDVQANIRVFYYQYLKLCFEAVDCDYEQYLRRIEDIINDENFSFVFEEDEDPSIFNDLQFKQLITQFFGYLGTGNTNIEASLNQFPIIDTVFIYFFRSILILTDTIKTFDQYIDKMTLFGVLTSHFNVQIDVHQNCIRFPQTDIFVYEEDPSQVFMAYLQGESDAQELPVSREYVSYEASQQTIAPPPFSKQENNVVLVQTAIKHQETSYHLQGKIQIKDSYIEGEFLDYTSSGPALQNLVQPNKLKQSGNIKQQKQKVTESTKPSQVTKAGVNQFEEVLKPNLIEYKTVKSDYKSDYSSQSQYNQIKNPVQNKVDQVGNSRKLVEIDNKRLQQFSYSASSWEAKESTGFKTGFIANTSNPLPAYGTSNYNQSSYQSFKDETYSNKPTAMTNSANILNNFLSGSNSKHQMPAKKPNSYAPIPQPSFQSKKPSSYDPLNYLPQPSASVASSKNPCGLNVSNQFTNSFTMKLMNQPHRSSVSGIRQRARNYRNSLINFIK